MNLPGLSVRRPVLTTMVTLIVCVIGAVSLSRLNTDLLPAVELPTVSVDTNFPGASPETVERVVTQIVEEIIATVPGVEEISSTSSRGRSTVRVTFGMGVDPDAAGQDVRATIEDEINELPDTIDRPRINKFDVNSFPVVILGVSGDLSPVELTTLVNDELRSRFGRVPGVAQVDLWGEYQREIRVQVDPLALRALGLPLLDVVDALRDANLDLPAGQLERGRFDVTLRAPAEFRDVEQIRETVVAVRNGVSVPLGQIAEVSDTFAQLTRNARVNGQRGLRVGIRKQADANTVEVAEGILAEIEASRAEFPQLVIEATSNQGNFIERSIANVARSVAYGGGLAVLVLLLFLRSWRSTLVVALAIPIALIATFALLYFGGLTLNLMTLGGLALGVGMMVDNAIVVLENIFRRRTEEGEDARVAAERGANEVATAIVASTVTTLVIFLPLVFVRGVSGELFGALGLVVVFSLTASLLVSLTLVPMLAAALLSPGSGEGPKTRAGRALRGFGDRFFDRLASAYEALLQAALGHRWKTVAAALALLVSSLWLYPLIGQEFLPASDEGEVRVDAELEVGTRLSLVDEKIQEIEAALIREVPETVSWVARSGTGSQGGVVVNVGPAASRDRSNAEIADAVRAALDGQVAGAELRVRAPAGQRVLERILGSSEEGLTVEIRGFELEILSALATRVAELAEGIAGVTDVDVSREDAAPELRVDVDRRKAASLGLSPRSVAEALEAAVAGADAGEFRVGGNSHRILVRLADAQTLSLDEVLDMTLGTPAGQEVALRNLVSVQPGSGPTQIQRKDQQRIVTVTANLSGRDLGSVAAELEAGMLALPRPAGYTLAVAGAYREQQEATRELLLGMGLSLLLVYMVLACQYESIRDPLVVMVSVPVAAAGVLLTLFITETTFNLQSWIGCVILGGIVVNNAILLVDQANQLQRDRGLSPREAVAEAGRRRLRPILMTTLTTLLGLAPLALGIGEGADAQAPLARAVIGGLAASTLITLLLVPAVYTLFHRTPGGEPARTRGPEASAEPAE